MCLLANCFGPRRCRCHNTGRAGTGSTYLPRPARGTATRGSAYPPHPLPAEQLPFQLPGALVHFAMSLGLELRMQERMERTGKLLRPRRRRSCWRGSGRAGYARRTHPRHGSRETNRSHPPSQQTPRIVSPRQAEAEMRSGNPRSARRSRDRFPGTEPGRAAASGMISERRGGKALVGSRISRSFSFSSRGITEKYAVTRPEGSSCRGTGTQTRPW